MTLTNHARKASRHVRTVSRTHAARQKLAGSMFSWSTHTRFLARARVPSRLRDSRRLAGTLASGILTVCSVIIHYSFHLATSLNVGEFIDIGANIGALSLDWLSRKPAVGARI